MDQTLKRIVFSKGAQKLKDTLYKRKSSIAVRTEQHSVTFSSDDRGPQETTFAAAAAAAAAAATATISEHENVENLWEVEVADGISPMSFSSNGAGTRAAAGDVSELSSPASTSSDACDSCDCGSELGIRAEIMSLKASLERLQAKVAKSGTHDADNQESKTAKTASSSPRLKPRKLDLGEASAHATTAMAPPAYRPKQTPQTMRKAGVHSTTQDRTPFPVYEESPFQKGVQQRYAALSKDRSGATARDAEVSCGGVEDDDDDPVSFWDFATDDIGLRSGYSAEAFREGRRWKRKRAYWSMEMVMNIESVQFLGLAVCLDTLLYMFTILPVRFGIALLRLFQECGRRIVSGIRFKMQGSKKATPGTPACNDSSAVQRRSWCGRGGIGDGHTAFHRMHAYDVARGVILIVSPYALSWLAGDISWLYHVIRTQEFMKLYVIFNMLDIFDRLVTVFGQESFERLYRTICYYDNKKTPVLAWTLFTAGSAAMVYVILHSLVSFVQIVTLNVAMSSKYSSVMLLLISSNFVEIKGLVFKRFDESNLFQITCADVTERFFLYLSLFCVFVQNADFTRGGMWLSPIALVPDWTEISSFRWFGLDDIWDFVVDNPAFAVIFGEMVVDLVKHSFILKFNNIPASVYQKFAAIIAEDATMYRLGSGKKKANTESQESAPGRSNNSSATAESTVDPTHAVTQRLGLPSFALAAVLIRIAMRVYRQVVDAEILTHGLPIAATVVLLFLCLCCLKLLVSMAVACAARRVKQNLANRYAAEKAERMAHEQFYGQQPKHWRHQRVVASKQASSTSAPSNGLKTRSMQRQSNAGRRDSGDPRQRPANSVSNHVAQHATRPGGLPPRTPGPSDALAGAAGKERPIKRTVSPDDVVQTPSEPLDKLRNIKRFELHGKRVV